MLDKAIPKGIHEIYPILDIQQEHIRHLALLNTAHLALPLQRIRRVKGRRHQRLPRGHPIIGTGKMRNHPHIITEGIGTEVTPEGHNHITFPHHPNGRYRQLLDVLCCGEEDAHDLVLGHLLYRGLGQLS